MRHVRKLAGAIVFFGVFVVNPAFVLAGCTSFDFGEREALAVVDVAANGKTYRFSVDGAEYELTLAMRPSAKPIARAEGGLVASARACGDRSFVKSASACLDTTSIPVEGTASLTRVSPARAVVLDHEPTTGKLVLYGKTLGGGRLDVGASDAPLALLDTRDARSFELRGLRAERAGVAVSYSASTNGL